MRDRFFDLHVRWQMQKIVETASARWPARPLWRRAGRSRLTTALGMTEEAIGEEWAMGAGLHPRRLLRAPALFYADKVIR